ncbi:MAG: c-type cytochrome [Limnohabitans sp.]
MNKILLALMLGATTTGTAVADEALAKARNCMACHAPASKLVGPAYRDVARKYANDAGAADRLAIKVIKGGSGAWGAVPMPANPQVSETDARRLVAWILSQK